ncbi:MAG: DUF1294 domain-containing protein [Oscillospiraceae bacterium]|nr:DUF1294 domain-containing protein [Oscillospiraceae bacterium]
MPDILLCIGIYLTVVNIVAVRLVFRDKRTAQSGLWRVKERTLLFISAIGGSVAMFLTMRVVRHKTKHAKFMVGIPVIIFFQVTIVFLIWWWLKTT